MPSIFHEPTIALAGALQEASKAKFEAAPNDLVRDAMFVLTHDAVCVHRAIGAVVDAGWPGPGAALLRTLLDINVSMLAVVNSEAPALASFRYFYSGFRRHARDQAFTPAVRKHMFEQIRSRIRQLPADLQVNVLGVIKEKDRRYWYSEEFSAPSDILREFGAADMDWIYAQLSGTAHGSFMGLRLYRENPDAISIDPEQPGRKALGVDLTSCHLVAELLKVRDTVEELGMARAINDLDERVRIAAVGP